MTCSAHAQIPAGRPVPVTVNGVAIPRDAIQREMQHHPAAKPIAAWQQAVQALVVRELLLQRARHLGLAPEPASDAEGRRETDDEALIRGVVEREVSVPEPDDETCRRYYERNQSRFRSPDIFEVSHILFAALPSDRNAYARARADADTVLAVLKDAPDRFAELARAHSQCPSAAQGGNLGQITRGQTTPEFEQALFVLEPGDLCAEPVATRYGFHLIRLERKTPGRLLPFEALALRIADYLRDSVQRRASAQYVARLASAATVTGIEMPGAVEHRVS
ncbi:MAG: peptidylprolyl isomerase [Pseudolabrys sp.]